LEGVAIWEPRGASYAVPHHAGCVHRGGFSQRAEISGDTYRVKYI
jgi:hypothetical protein